MARDDLAPERARSWIVAACCCFCTLIFFGVSRLSGIMLVAATHTFHVSRARAAVPFSLSTAIRNLTGVFVGHLGHRFGVGPVVAAGSFIASLGAGLCFFANDMLWLSLCWGGIFGFGFGLATCLLPLAINQNFSKNSGAASGISYSGAYIGSFIFPPIVVWLLDNFGFQGTFLIISGGVLNAFVAAMLLKEPGNKKKYFRYRSSSGTDCNEIYKQNNVKGKCIHIKSVPEISEVWKRNINTTYLDSQNNFICGNGKVYSKNDASTFQPYLFQNTVDFKNHSEEDAFELYYKNNHDVNCEVNMHTHNLLSNVFKNSGSTFLVHPNDFDKGCATYDTSQEIYLIFSSPSGSNKEQFHPEIKNMIVYPPKHVTSINCNAKGISAIPKVYFRRIFGNKLLWKRKYKAKYKLKLQKLKKTLATSLLNSIQRFRNEDLETDNVKLMSFKYLQTLCPSIPYITTTNNYFKSSSLQHLSARKCSFGERHQSPFCFTRKFSNCDIVPQRPKSGKMQPKVSEVKIQPSSEVQKQVCLLNPKDWLKNNDKFYICRSEDSKNSCKTTTEIKNDSFRVISPSNEIYEDLSKIDASNIGTENNSPVFRRNFSLGCHKHKTEFRPTEIMFDSASESSLARSDSSSKSRSTKNASSSSNDRSNSSGFKSIKKCLAGWYQMLHEPMFLVISFTVSIQTFIVVCVVTTIEDFAKDMGIPENRVHYALMVLSIANLIGTVTLGAVTDRGFISRHRFLSLCFFGMSLSLVVVSLVAVSLSSLLPLVAIYGLLESGVIITLPILIKQFVEGEKRQAVAIASSNVMSAPTVMLVPMLIGHFRDNIGSYTGLFLLLAATSLVCSIIWIVAPSIYKRRIAKKNAEQRNVENC